MPGGSHEPFGNEYYRHKKGMLIAKPIQNYSRKKYHKYSQDSKHLAANNMIEQYLICLLQE